MSENKYSYWGSTFTFIFFYLLITWFWTNTVADSLNKWSGNVLIPELQKEVPPSSISWELWDYFSRAGGAKTQMAFCGLMAIFYNQKTESAVLIVNLALQIFVVDAWKTYEHAPRPFWVHDFIKSSKCYTQFGNPSGHSIAAAYFAMYIYFFYVKKQSDFEHYMCEDDFGNRIKSAKLFDKKSTGNSQFHERLPIKQYEI